MDPLEIFDNFKLDTLDEKWSDEVWSREFITFPEPPVEYSIFLGSEDMETCLKETCTGMKKWIAENKNLDESNDQEKPKVSWQTLTVLSINIRGLLALLGYLMKAGQAIGADEDSRQSCLSAASLYFILLSIPGSSTFHVFHPNLYERAIDTLKLSEHLVNKKSHRATDLASLYADQHEEMLQSEKLTLVKGLNSLLFDLITMLRTFYMKYQARSLEMTIISLIEVTKLENEVNHFQNYQSKVRGASKTSLSYNAYIALQDLCDPNHGNVEDIIRLVMRYLMQHLCPNYLDLPPKAASIVWDTIIHFIKNLLDSKGSSAELGFETLIQHLLIKCPDRSEPRQKQAIVVSKLINMCQGEIFFKCINNLINFSFHNKIPCRIFAQEVIAKLLPEITANIAENGIKNREKAQMLLISTTFSRCDDVSSMVRGKAMSIIESIANNQKLTVRDFLDMSEEDKPFPTEEVLLGALATDINPLPGPNTFNSMLLDRIKDERALVRRSTIHVLQNLVTHFAPLLQKVAPIVGHHCRDPALTVRKDAIQTLTSLLQSNPNSEMLLSEYIKAVLPRIYDVETKVQEKVLESLQNLVLDKITPFSEENNDEEHSLPWKVIKELTLEKMRKNLSKICDSWVKNGVITKSLIIKVKSHIGKNHDMEVWVLLSAFAENIKLTNMDKYFEDYKTILEGNDFVTTLKLEVLRHAWQGMSKSYLEGLCEYIFNCLHQFQVNLESIGTCIDILSGITNYLQGSKAEEFIHSQVVGLMKVSESQIEQLIEEDNEINEENIDAYLKAMNVLGHASFLCSESVSTIVLNIIQGVLLDCSSIKTSDECLKRLKAAGVVVLAQQAMRDREIAEEVMPILGRLMCRNNTSESLAEAAIRINAVKALADLCIRFTALVEPYLSDMCISMKDPNARVREAIVVIFVQLLLEDYIKVKGAFFYHILTMLSDNDETIRELTIFLIKERLLAKNKTLISQSFVRSLFHYNNCQTRHKVNEKKLRKREREALTLPGQKNEPKRRMIYDFMLEHLDPPSKLKILTKLNSEILEGVCEKSINVKQTEGACVLQDVMYIISNDRIQPSFGTKMQDEDIQDESATAAIENLTNNAINVIAEGMKKFKRTVMLQTLIRLRQFLSSSRSPLLQDVSKCFLKILSDFNKDQQAEILDEHPNLKKDLERDISVSRKTPETSGSDSDKEHKSVEKRMIEESESCFRTKKIVKATESPTKNKSIQQKSATTPKRKIEDVQLNSVPRIVLRRLSTLTYPGIKEWLSPPRDSRYSQSSDPGPSSSGISVSSNSSSTEEVTTSSFDFSEPELCSTPKPKRKLIKLSKETVNVQNF